MKTEKEIRVVRDSIELLIRHRPESAPPEAQQVADTLAWVLGDASKPSYQLAKDTLADVVRAAARLKARLS